jgi:hypothetical protein
MNSRQVFLGTKTAQPDEERSKLLFRSCHEIVKKYELTLRAGVLA